MNRFNAGHSITEYALIFGVVVVLCLFSLTGLGGAIFKLFGNAGQALASDGSGSYGKLIGLLSPTSGGTGMAASVNLPGPKGATGTNTSAMPDSAFIKPVTSGSVNVNSVEGVPQKVYTSMQLAKQLKELAGSINDPSGWAAQMAHLAYLSGGVEGLVEGMAPITGFESSKLIDGQPVGGFTQEYTANSGYMLRDIEAYRQNMQWMLNNPPKNISPTDYAKVKALAMEVNGIAAGYVQEKGGVPAGLNDRVPPYGEMIAYDSLETGANGLLDQGSINPQGVKTTLSDGRALAGAE